MKPRAAIQSTLGGAARRPEMARVQVSALIPVFNGGRFLALAIDSALAQAGVTIEVIVVDDGSTDDTPAILAGYGSRLAVVRQANGGLAAARNAGLARACGDVVAFLDADDTWEPEKSRAQLAYLDAHPECALVSCDAFLMNADGKRGAPILGDRAQRLPAGRCLEALFLGNFVLLPGAMVRRETLAAVGGFDETVPGVEDYDLWLRIAAVAGIGVLPRPLASYRSWPGQMSRNRAQQTRSEARVLTGALARHPELRRALGGRARRRLARLFDEAGYRELQEAAPARAAAQFLDALRTDPAWGKPWRHLLAAALAAGGLWSPPPPGDGA
jgi:glycosyltransferase involved in cell wall biosynthesis